MSDRASCNNAIQDVRIQERCRKPIDPVRYNSLRRKQSAGIELANHVADVAQRVFHSARTWRSSDYSEQAKPNLERVPMLTHLSPDAGASFCDGQSIRHIDSVIYCTGYQYKYRFLEHLNLISTGV